MARTTYDAEFIIPGTVTYPDGDRVNWTFISRDGTRTFTRDSKGKLVKGYELSRGYNEATFTIYGTVTYPDIEDVHHWTFTSEYKPYVTYTQRDRGLGRLVYNTSPIWGDDEGGGKSRRNRKSNKSKKRKSRKTVRRR